MKSIHQRTKFDRGLILSLRNNLLDAEVVIDDCRRELGVAVERLRQAVQSRDMLARQLGALVDAPAA
jgi:hypothetical protein